MQSASISVDPVLILLLEFATKSLQNVTSANRQLPLLVREQIVLLIHLNNEMQIKVEVLSLKDKLSFF